MLFIAGFDVNAHEFNDLDKATKKVQDAIRDSAIESFKYYCVFGTMTCRGVYVLKDKNSGKRLDAFYTTFFSSERQLAGTEYFLPACQDMSEYESFSDNMFDGAVKISEIYDENVEVKKDEKGFPTRIANIRLNQPGSTKYVIANLDYEEAKVTLSGVVFDKNDPKFKQPIKIEYVRVYPSTFGY